MAGGGSPPPPVGPPRGGSMLFPCVAVRVTVACVTASATLSRRTSGAARADQAARRPWDLVVLLQVVSFGCVEGFVSV